MPSVRSRGERLPEAAALAAVGGFLDAYSFIAHGGVFANAQTGNVVLFGVEATRGDWVAAARHVPPFVAFLVGVATVEVFARLRERRGLRRPTQLILIIEIVVFAAVGLLPSSVPDVVSTVLIAWAASLQVATFRTVDSVTYNTTFTTGNLRALVAETAAWFGEHDRAARRRATVLAVVVGSFTGGAVIGGVTTHFLHAPAVLVVLPGLAAVLTSIAVHSARLARAAGPPATALPPTPAGPAT